MAVLSVAAAIAVAGCGSDDEDGSEGAASAQPAAATGRPALEAGGSERQAIVGTVRSFYAATASNRAEEACTLFTAGGERGFMAGAKRAFPGLVTDSTTCERAMEVFAAALLQSVQSLEAKGAPVEATDLKRVEVADVRVSGDRARATAPIGLLAIRPKRLALRRQGDTWKLDGSRDFRRQGSG